MGAAASAGPFFFFAPRSSFASTIGFLPSMTSTVFFTAAGSGGAVVVGCAGAGEIGTSTGGAAEVATDRAGACCGAGSAAPPIDAAAVVGAAVVVGAPTPKTAHVQRPPSTSATAPAAIHMPCPMPARRGTGIAPLPMSSSGIGVSVCVAIASARDRSTGRGVDTAVLAATAQLVDSADAGTGGGVGRDETRGIRTGGIEFAAISGRDGRRGGGSDGVPRRGRGTGSAVEGEAATGRGIAADDIAAGL